MVPRSSHGEWTPAPGRFDPVGVLEQQATTRVAELIPVRHERMLATPFTFYRGAAAIMAADLATTPNSGFTVQACGDAHLSNFGGFQSPERQMLFDINDFDETLPGPWEWDVKRLAASFAIACEDREFDDATERALVSKVVASYRNAMRAFATTRTIDVWYSRLDVEGILERWRNQVPSAVVKRFEKNVAKAQNKNSLRASAKLTEEVDGRTRIISDPPLIVRYEDLPENLVFGDLFGFIDELLHSYTHTMQADRRRMLADYDLVDFARKVVGVGSVGTRCYIALLRGRDENDPLFLQIKEAEASVLEPFVGAATETNHGERVVNGQRLMQAASDVLLGWERVQNPSGEIRDFYVRQLWDGKLSVDVSGVEPATLSVYAEMCGWTLARAHARSGDRIAIASYLGGGDAFDRAIVEFAYAYAAQNMSDYEAATAAVRAGRIRVATSA